MERLKNIFEIHATETGIFIVALCLLLLIIEIITLVKSDIENSKFITLKSFFKDWFFLLLMLFLGLQLIFKNV